MNTALFASILALTALSTTPRGPDDASPSIAPVQPSAGALPATGSFTQTGITSLEVRTFGPVTILEQTSFGVVDGTLSGSFEDDLRVVIKPNGRFSTSFTLTVDGTVGGEQGVVTLQAADAGRLVGPTTGYFQGVAVITDATGELAGLRGLLEIEGMVDLVSGLWTYTYEGTLRTNSRTMASGWKGPRREPVLAEFSATAADDDTR